MKIRRSSPFLMLSLVTVASMCGVVGASSEILAAPEIPGEAEQFAAECAQRLSSLLSQGIHPDDEALACLDSADLPWTSSSPEGSSSLLDLIQSADEEPPVAGPSVSAALPEEGYDSSLELEGWMPGVPAFAPRMMQVQERLREDRELRALNYLALSFERVEIDLGYCTLLDLSTGAEYEVAVFDHSPGATASTCLDPQQFCIPGYAYIAGVDIEEDPPLIFGNLTAIDYEMTTSWGGL